MVNLRGTITRLKTENQQLSLMLHEATSSAGTVNTSPMRMSSFGSEVGTLPESLCGWAPNLKLPAQCAGECPSVPGWRTAATQHSPCRVQLTAAEKSSRAQLGLPMAAGPPTSVSSFDSQWGTLA